MDIVDKRPKRKIQKKWDPSFVSSINITPKSEPESIAKSSDSTSPKKRGQKSNSEFKSSKKIQIRTDTSFEDLSIISFDETISTQSTRKNKKLCDKFGCSQVNCKVTCFAKATEKCPKEMGEKSSRWYHVSCAEHYCNDCFEMFYRSQKIGYSTFLDWKRNWMNNCLSEATVKLFLMDTHLPYWLQCRLCQKWREVPATTDVNETLIDNFCCASEYYNGDCMDSENELVAIALTCKPSLLSPPLFSRTPIAPFLVNYYADGVNMNATCSQSKASVLKMMQSNADKEGMDEYKEAKEMKIGFPIVPGVPSYFQPFVQPQTIMHARGFPPDIMTTQEIEAFPHLNKSPQIYLIIRNTALVLWTLNPKVVLTVEACVRRIICRGLVRIRCVKEVEVILEYLSINGFINTGIFEGNIPFVINMKKSVIIVGAGVSGLAAARHLTNFGFEVMMLEAREEIGGRVRDDTTLGMCVSKGSQVVHGCTNNPITLLCHQTNTRLIVMNDMCTLIDSSGQIVSSDTASIMDLHFNALLDNVNSWRKRKPREDCSVLEKLKEMHLEFIEESQMSFTEEEESLFNFNLRHMESVSGASLDQLSVLNFDHCEKYPQFVGASSLAPNGFSEIFQHLAKNIDLRLNTAVSLIDYTNERIKVTTFGGTEFDCDFVVVTLPVACLKKQSIKFQPALPDTKIKAIEEIAIGQMEKVILKFEKRFWIKKCRGYDSFACVSSSLQNHPFQIFHDITARIPLKDKSYGILVTTLSGKSLEQMRNCSDQEIRNNCLSQLRSFFPEEDVAEPISYLVTHWRDDVNSGMCFSYLPIGSSPTCYQDIAAPVNKCLYFAGEATSEEHPQSVTGAYLTGIRDAASIIQTVCAR